MKIEQWSEELLNVLDADEAAVRAFTAREFLFLEHMSALLLEVRDAIESGKVDSLKAAVNEFENEVWAA